MDVANSEDNAVMAAYCRAAIAGDADAAADVYNIPVTMYSAAPPKVYASRDELRAALAAAYAQYKLDGITDVQFGCGRAFDLGPHLRQLEVRWHATRADGSIAIATHSWYILQRTDRGLKIAGSIRVA
jgi:hypothetical protein